MPDDNEIIPEQTTQNYQYFVNMRNRDGSSGFASCIVRATDGDDAWTQAKKQYPDHIIVAMNRV